MKLRPLKVLTQLGTRVAVGAAMVAATLIPLRPYQTDLINEINVEWLKGHRNVLGVSATGSGKTVVFSNVIANEPGASIAIAHRHELVSQISMALARNGVRHRVIGSSQLAGDCRAAHLDELGASYVDPNARCAVASVDTLVKMDASDPWFASVRLWVMDEAHHVLKHNKWGTAVGMFPNARGLGVTAETERADGYGLGAQNDGVFHAMVLAPTMRDLINMGFLTDYRVISIKSDLDLSKIDISKATGDYSSKKLAKATKGSHITGDIVAAYLKYAPGKLGITFAVDIDHATQIAAEFRRQGVPAEVVSSKTEATRRRQVLKDFKARRILQLVNVDLFGEGFDLPAIEVVSMGRATQSFNLFKQQFGRALRLLDGKQYAIIIDHVGNVVGGANHGLPDKHRDFSLGRPTPRAQRLPDEDLIPMRVCGGCSQPYERTYFKCPYPGCGHMPEPVARTGPAFVDGDLYELSPETLARMRGEVDAVMSAFIPMPNGVSDIAARAIKTRHFERQRAQHHLRETMALWSGWHHSQGKSDREIQRLFFLTYGHDVLGAQALNAGDADELRQRLQARLSSQGVIAA